MVSFQKSPDHIARINAQSHVKTHQSKIYCSNVRFCFITFNLTHKEKKEEEKKKDNPYKLNKANGEAILALVYRRNMSEPHLQNVKTWVIFMNKMWSTADAQMNDLQSVA